MKPYRLLSVRQRDFFQRLERPPLFTFVEVDLAFRFDWCLAIARVRCSEIDPLCEVGDHVVRQLAGGRHFHAIILQRFKQQTLRRFPLDQHQFTRFTACRNSSR